MRVGGVYLTDFGLAKDTATGSKFTRSGTTLGTPAYMSPEQARGEVGALTPASDVWALGCVLYEALAGRPAFHGETPAATIGMILTRSPQPLPGAPVPVREVVAVALQREPSQRPQSADAWRPDLDRVVSGLRPLHRATGATGPRLLLAVVALIALAGAGFGTWWAAHAQIDAPTTGAATDPLAQAEAAAARAWDLRHDDVEAASTQLEAVLAGAPQLHQWRVRLGLLRWSAGRNAEARAVWKHVDPASPSGPLARWYLAFEWLSSELSARHVLIIDEVKERFSGIPPEREALATALLAIADVRPDEARAAVAQAPPGWETELIRGVIETTARSTGSGGDPDREAEAYERGWRDGLALPWVVLNASGAHTARGDVDAATRTFATAKTRWPTHPAVLSAAISDLYRQGDRAGALAAAEAAVERHPDQAPLYYARAVLRGEAGDIDGERADLEATLARDPLFAMAYVNRGNLAARAGDPEAALADYLEAARIRPTLVEAHESRAAVLLQLKRYEEALEPLGALMRLCPDRNGLRADRARTRLRLGNDAGALEDYLELLRRDPDHRESLMNTSALLVHQRRLDEAEPLLARLLELEPDNVFGLANRGVLKYHRGDFAGAEADYRAALAIEPDNGQAKRNLAQLRDRLRREGKR